MASINRGTLPQNFIDSVSTGTRLPTPEPQYWFAKMALGARMALQAVDAGQQTVQQFVSMAGGGKVLDPGLDELARAADTYPEAVQAVDGFGLGKGDTIKFWRDIFAGGGYTEGARVLSTDATISTTGQTIQTEEVPVVLKEYHGPHDGTSVKPYAIWDFDAKYRAAKEQLANKVTRHLRRDITKWLDVVIRDLFRVTPNITYSDSVTNVASFTAGAGHIMTLDTIMRARKAISDREWKPFPNGRYVLTVPTQFNIDMFQDQDYRELSKFHAQDRNLLYGYIGSVQDVDIFEVSTLKTYVNADGAVPGDGQTTPANVTTQEALMFGPGAVGFGTAAAPECRWADDTNYGTVAKVIWYGLMAFQTLDVRGIQRILFQTG